MKGAVIKSVAEFAEVVTGGTPSTTKPEYWDGDVPWLNSGSLNEGVITTPSKYITQLGLDNSSAKLMPKDTVLVALTGATTGQVGFLAIEASANQSVTGILPSKEHYPKYLYFFLKAQRKKMLGDAFGGAQPHINQKYIKDFKIPLPPLNDQVRIARLLSNVEGLIAQRKQYLQQLDDLLKSVFLEMFGDPVRNEKGWDVDRVGRSIKVQGGFAFKSKDIASSGNIKLVKIANVHVEDLTWDDVSYVPDSFIERHKRFALQEGDLLIALTRPVIKSLNVVKTATVRKKDLPCLLNQRVARFLIDQSQTNKRFFLQYCYTEFFRNTVEGLCPPGLQPNVSTNQIEEIPFFYPPIDLQNEFAAVAGKVEGIKSRYHQSLTDLETLYGALSQLAFKGKLDLSRVPMPGTQPEEDKTVAAEPLNTPAAQGLAINLPDTGDLLDAFASAEAREGLISQWLEAYRGQLGSTLFSVQQFMTAAQTRLAELHPDNDFVLGANDYEHIKAWVFEALAAGTLTQAFEDELNRVTLKSQPADWGSW